MDKEIVTIGCDAGGTMTDIFMIDAGGMTSVGKASTTPKREHEGFWNSMVDAAEEMGIDWEKEGREVLSGVQSVTYCGTTMMNVVLTHQGSKVGLIVSAANEDVLLHERAANVYAGYSFEDRMHKATHIHNIPLVPRKCVKGVTERLDAMGMPVIPLYVDEAREAVEQLLEEGVESIAICFHFSFMNPMHEVQMAQIAKEVMQQKGLNLPVHLSHEVVPINRECPRTFSLLLDAYAAEPGRKQLEAIESKLQEGGFKHSLNIMLASGAVAEVEYQRLHEGLFAAPVGGVLGAMYIGKLLGMENVVCSDQGGTSFDVGVIKKGQPSIERETEVAHYKLNVPTIAVETIGAGAGMYVSLDPVTQRIRIGPESTGAEPGPVCYNMGNQTPTVLDCFVINGMLNPDYYLGGKVKLYPDLALAAIKEQCAEPLGIDAHDFAEGVIEMVNARLREQVKTTLAVRGYTPADYHLISYGGAGPMFVCGYTEGLPFKSVFTVPFAGAFSAFGLTTLDYSRRFHQSTMVVVPYGAPDWYKEMMAGMMNQVWAGLLQRGVAECEEAGYPKESVVVEHLAYMRYGFQLEDLEVVSPVSQINTGADMDKLTQTFDDIYSKVYVKAAAHKEAGYTILELGVRCSVPRVKPVIPEYPLEGKEPPSEAFKGTRKVYQKGKWEDAGLYEMDMLRPGNTVEGLAVIEAPSTTLFVPAGKKVRSDSRKFLFIENC